MPDQILALDQAKTTLVDLGIKFGPKLFIAILILVAGFYAGRWIGMVFDRWLARLKLEPPVRLLLVRVARLIVLALFFVMALQNLGVDLLPLIAGLSVVGAGVALAMQGVLGNLAAGLTIIFTQPFRVGEYIAIAGVEGQVENIELFSTTLSHPDRSTVVVPNRRIVGEILHNYGKIRQLDLSVALGRSEDVEPALALVHDAVNKNPRVLKEPAPFIGVAKLSDASIALAIKPWVQVDDFVPAAAEINRAVVEAMRNVPVAYPAPRRVHIAGGLTSQQ